MASLTPAFNYVITDDNDYSSARRFYIRMRVSTMTSSRFWPSAAALSACVVFFSQSAVAAPAATVDVDAREIGRGLQHVHLVLPVKPGKLTLIYPKWLPGEHAPTGPIG